MEKTRKKSVRKPKLRLAGGEVDEQPSRVESETLEVDGVPWKIRHVEEIPAKNREYCNAMYYVDFLNNEIVIAKDCPMALLLCALMGNSTFRNAFRQIGHIDYADRRFEGFPKVAM